MASRESLAERRARRAAVDDPAVVLNAAARYLEARSRSISEVRRHLTGAGYRPTLVEGAIARLTQLGYLDDETFARTWVSSRDRARPRGERALRSELARKGIDDATMRAVLAARGRGEDDAGPGPNHALDEAPGSADERAALRLLAKKGPALMRETDPRARRQKAYGLLARNGFDPGIAARLSEPYGRTSGDERESADAVDAGDAGDLEG